MSFLVPLTLFGWIPFVLFLFVIFPPRMAVISAFLLAWLFLPMAGYGVPGLPDYTKMSATVVGVLIGAALFDTERLMSFRPRWVDIPMAIFCFCPIFSSTLNGLGVYDGLAEIVRQMILWGLPYYIGRVYFTDLTAVRDLAIGIFVGGLIYVPLCLFEIRMSPNLHVWVYGFRQHSFAQQIREGIGGALGYRPMVFMQHGLMVAMWMSMTAVVGTWLWKSKSIRAIWDVPMWMLVPPLLGTAYLCKSRYALVLLLAGLALLWMTKWLRSPFLVACLIAFPPIYMTVRATGFVRGEQIVSVARGIFGEDRANSLDFRIKNENLVSEWAMKKPWFGWGGWGRASDDTGRDAVTDSLWIIFLGKFGVVGLLGLTAAILLPMILVIRDYRVELWTHPAVAPVVVLAMICLLYMCDHMMNGMVNPIFMLAVGGVLSAHFAIPQQARVMMSQMGPRQTLIDPRVRPSYPAA